MVSDFRPAVGVMLVGVGRFPELPLSAPYGVIKIGFPLVFKGAVGASRWFRRVRCFSVEVFLVGIVLVRSG